MPRPLIIREAVAADAAAMTRLRAASIGALCTADHHDNPAAIASWVGEPDKFDKLLAAGALRLLVAEIDGVMAGLAGWAGDRVALNYVNPGHRLGGVSKALMQVIEERMAADGVALGRLESTRTALQFYRAIGWVEHAGGTPETGYPMTKRL